MKDIEIRVMDNIADIEADAVVNAANEDLAAGGGVCGAIFAAAGRDKLQRACNEIGHCDTGKAVITDGFNLKAKKIIHAVGPRWNGEPYLEEDELYNAYINSLRLAMSNNCHSIAIPLLSAGIFGCPPEISWSKGIRASLVFKRDYPDYDLKIIFVARKASLKEIGEKELLEQETDLQKNDMEPKLIKIYVSDMGKFTERSNYVFIAAFHDFELVNNYLRYMEKKKRYRMKDIIIVESEDTSDGYDGKIASIITSMGEILYPDEYEFS